MSIFVRFYEICSLRSVWFIIKRMMMIFHYCDRTFCKIIFDLWYFWAQLVWVHCSVKFLQSTIEFPSVTYNSGGSVHRLLVTVCGDISKAALQWSTRDVTKARTRVAVEGKRRASTEATVIASASRIRRQSWCILSCLSFLRPDDTIMCHDSTRTSDVWKWHREWHLLSTTCAH